MTIRHAFGAIALAAALALAPQVASAFGGGSSSSSSTTTQSDYLAGKKAVDAGDYEQAISLLARAIKADPRDADSHNLLAFSYRKLGRLDDAMRHYNTALEIDANHRGANEYIGELFLELGDLAHAESHLTRLGKTCSYSCPEYRELKAEVAAYRAKSGG